NEQQQRAGAFSFDCGEELLLVVLMGDRKKPRHEAYNGALIRVAFDLVRAEHLDSGVDQKSAEDVNDPVKTLDQCCADEDHCQTHYQRAHHAPEKHAVLKLRWYLEVRKDQQKDEQIID